MKMLAKTRYLGSTFFGHSRAEDLVQNFNLINQISMDGPRVNHIFHRLVKVVLH